MNAPDPPGQADTGPRPGAQQPAGWLPRTPEAIFGAGATAEEAYALLTVDVPAARWIPALEAARDELGCTYFDWLSAVDEPGTGLRVCAHVAALPGGTGAPHTDTPHTGVRRLLVRTTVPHEAPTLPTATAVYAGAAWHERETHEMFGIGFTGHPHLDPLLLPDGFEGHPLRKEFVLAARVAKAWPGAKEPGESGHGGPQRRQMLPPGVPDPNEWGPLKGRLPPAPSRPARARTGGAAGDRPARRTRTAGGGSASQRGADAGAEAAPAEPRRPARRARSASEGSVSQRPDRGVDHGGGITPAQEDGGSATPGAAPPQGGTGASGPGSASPGDEQDVPAAGPGGASTESVRPDRRAEPEANRASGVRNAAEPWHRARPASGDEEPGPEGQTPADELSPDEPSADEPSDEGPRDDEGGTH